MSQYKTQEEAEAAGVRVRKVTSFVLREGRLTTGQQKAIDTLWPQMGLDYQAQQLDFATLFPQAGPVVMEIGFGMGMSLVEMAKASPKQNFIGIEVHRPGVGACLAEADKQGLTNLKVFNHDAVQVLANCIPDASLTRLQLFFPDPWHKKRHHKRRIVQPEFVQQIRQKLTIGGCFHMATDWQNYAEHMLEVMHQAAGFSNTATEGDYVARPDYRPLTKFEQRGQRLGHGVWDLIFKRVD